jgi:hypothetical protein
MDWEAHKEVSPTHYVRAWYAILEEWDTMFHGSEYQCYHRAGIMRLNASRSNAKFEVCKIGG